MPIPTIIAEPNAMRSTRVLFVVAALVLCITEVASAQKYETYTGFRVDTTPVLPDEEMHPRLYFDEAGAEQLRNRIPAGFGAPYGPSWFEVRGEALGFLGDDPAEEDASDRPRMAKVLGFWWQMTQDSTALRGAIDALMLAYDGVPQTDEKPYDEIYRATWIQNYAAAYDWVANELVPEEDAEIRNRLADEAQFLHENLADFGRPHNHVSKPAWGLGTIALAMSEHPNASDWLQNALEQMNVVTAYQFSADGIYREGGHYWMYSAVNMIPFLYQYLNVSGVDLFPDYEPAFVWPVKTRMGRGYVPNIEDSYLKPAPTHMVAAQYLDARTELNPSTSLGNVLQWNWDATELFTTKYTGASNDATWELDEFILWDHSIEPVAPTHSPTINMEGGQTIFRNSWDGGRDHRYLLFHGVPESDNHGHPDLLSFVAEAHDAYLIADAGYGPDGFSDDMRNSWYTADEAHNVVQVNGMPPWAAIPSNETPPTPYFIDSDFFGFAEKRLEQFLRNEDAAQRRAVAFVAEDYWVVTDLMTADETKTYESFLHGRGAFERFGNHATWTTFDDRYGQAAEIEAYFMPSTASFSDAPSYISLNWDGRRTSYVTHEVEAEDVALMQVLLPGLPDGPIPAVADLSTEDFTAAKVLKEGATDRFFAQPHRQAQSFDDVATDGTFAWTRDRDGEVEHLAVREATTIRVGAGVEIATDVVSTFAIDFTDPAGWLIHASAPRTREISAEIRHPNAAAVSTVFVGDAEVAFSRGAGGEILVDFTAVATAAERPDDAPAPDDIQLTNFPNPFQASTRIAFALDRAGAYRLEIFDILGRRVASWERSAAAPGRFHVEWDGTAVDGREMPSGTYFARIEHDDTGAMSVRTIVRIR